jgi:hypothetical protein
LVSSYTQGVAFAGGPHIHYSKTSNLQINYFYNFGLPLRSVLQFCVTSQLGVELLVSPHTQCVALWVVLTPVLQFRFDVKSVFEFVFIRTASP